MTILKNTSARPAEVRLNMRDVWFAAGTSATGVTAPGKGPVGPPGADPVAAEVVGEGMVPGMQ